MEISVINGGSCNGTGADGTDLKNRTLTKLTHMAWMRQSSECGIGNLSLESVKSSRVNKDAAVDCKSEFHSRNSFSEKNVPDSNIFQRERCATIEGSRRTDVNSGKATNRPASATPVAAKTPVSMIPSEEFDECGSDGNSDSGSHEGDGLDRNVVLERRRNLVKNISNRFFKNIKPDGRNFEQFCFVDELGLRRAFDRVLSHHRHVSKKADQRSSVPKSKSAAANISSSSSLNVQAPPFWPQTKNSDVKEMDVVCNDAKTVNVATPTSSARTSVLSASNIRVDPLLLGTQSSKRVIHKRGYILNRRPLTENGAQSSCDSQLVNRLDSQSQRQEYLRATLDELDALRLNNFTYFRSDDEDISTLFVEPNETDYTNRVPTTAVIRSIGLTSSMSNVVIDSISESKPRVFTSADNLSTATKSEYAPSPTTSMILDSSACISSAITPSSLTNSSCQSKRIVAPYYTSGKENNPMAEDFEVVSGTTVISSPKRASVMAAVTTVPNDDVTRQSWSPPDRTCRFSRSDSEFNVCFPSPPPRGGAYDTKAVSFRSDSNQRFTNFEARSNLPNNSSAPPSRDICDSRPQVGQSQQRNEVPSSCRNEIVPELVPYSDVRAGPTYSTRGDLHGILKSAQPPRAVDAVVSNLPAATCMTASPFSNPVQPVFATGQRDISSCYVSNQFTASRTPVNDDVRSRRSPGTPGADQKPRVSEQYSASLSHITTASPGRIQSDPSDRHPIVDVASLKSIPQPTSLPLKAVPKPIAQNISKCTALALPVSDVFNRHSGERTNIASINHAPSPPSASSRVAADQFSPVASFFCTDSSSSSSSSALISSHPHLYQQRAFVELANIGTTQTENQPSIQSSRYSSGVCQPTVPDISDYSSAPHIRGHFGEGCRNATNYSWKQFLPSSDLISHPSTSEQPPSRTTSQNPSASTFDRNLHATSSVQLQCPTSHSDMFASIASHNSLFNSRQDGPFVAVEAKVEGKLNSFVLGEKSDTVSHRSIIEAVRRPLPTPVSMPQLKLCESYLASGSNVAPSPRIAVVNQLSIAPRQSGSQSAANCGNNELAMDSARPTALRGVDLRTGFSQFGGSDETPFSNVGPTWTSTKASDNNPSKRVQVTGVPQSSGLLFES